MGQALRLFLTVLVVLCAFLPLIGAKSAPLLERGLAITDAFALRELDRGRFGLGRMLAPARSPNTPINDSELFALASLAPVRKALDEELQRYVEQHKAASPSESIGIG